MKQGRIYIPPLTYPPGKKIPHRILILSNSAIINRSRPGSFLVCAIIRSSISQQTGKAVTLVPNHSIPITVKDCISFNPNFTVLDHDSVIETHQLFHVSCDYLINQSVKALGDLNSDKLQEVLNGARKVF